MTITAGEVQVVVKAEIQKYTQDLQKARNQANQFSKSTATAVDGVSQSFGHLGTQLRSFSSVFMRGGALIAGVSALTAAFVSVSTRARQTADQMRLLDNRLSVIGPETRQTASAVERVVDEVSRSMNVSLDAARQAASELLRFRLPHGAFRDILDLSARLEISGFGNLAQSATRLADAINNPIQALEELQRAGVRFNEQTIIQIRNLTDLDRRWEAQNVLLDGLKKATEDVRANTPSLWSELVGLATDLADAVVRALSDFKNLIEGAEWAARQVMRLRNWVSGRSDVTRLQDRGVEQLTEDVKDLETALHNLRNGLSLTADLQRRISEILPGVFSPSWTSTIPGTGLFAGRIESGLAQVREALTELQAFESSHIPSPTTPTSASASRDYLTDLQNRLALERQLLFMNDAQERVERALYDLRERGVALTPAIEASLRDQIELTATLSRQMEGLSRAVESIFGNMTDTLVEFAKTGKFEFKRMADSIIEDMLRIAMRSFVMRPIMGLVPNIGGALFGGPSGGGSLLGFQSGGTVKVPGSGSGDRPTLMGLEPGEIVTITPKDRVAAGQAPKVINNINIQSSNEMQVEQRERSGPDGSVIIDTVVSEVAKRMGRGDFDNTFEGRYGVRPRTARR